MMYSASEKLAINVVVVIEYFPVDFPFSGGSLEAIPTETASTAIYEYALQSFPK